MAAVTKTEHIVYLMRGLPSCGKSYTAAKLAGETGVICETDEYFYIQVGDDPSQYNYDENLIEEARQWNFERFKKAIDFEISPVIVDRGNGLNTETQKYARYVIPRGYTVELQEPESPWWQEIRVLLKYKRYTLPILETWAKHLAIMSQSTHRVPLSVIRQRMLKWKYDLTVQDILDYEP